MYFGFNNISIDYKKRRVLDRVSLEVPKGKIVTIIGQNGCGKSSLLKTVSGAVRQTEGTVEYNAKSIRDYPRRQLAQKIAYLAQVHTSPPDIDVRTLVSYGRYPYLRFGHRRSADDAEIIDRTIALTGLDALQEHTLSTLSGGERQRAWLAMAVCQQPEILILDEPTTYLDISFQIEVLELVKRLNRELGMTILMVLHDLNLAARYSDRLIAIRNRGIFGEGCSSDMITEENMKSIFGLHTIVRHDEVNGCPFFIPLSPV